MDQFLKKHKLLKLTQGTDNLNSPVTILKVELRLQILQKMKFQTHMISLVNFGNVDHLDDLLDHELHLGGPFCLVLGLWNDPSA